VIAGLRSTHIGAAIWGLDNLMDAADPTKEIVCPGSSHSIQENIQENASMTAARHGRGRDPGRRAASGQAGKARSERQVIAHLRATHRADNVAALLAEALEGARSLEAVLALPEGMR
jgi:hypothetical protein